MIDLEKLKQTISRYHFESRTEHETTDDFNFVFRSVGELIAEVERLRNIEAAASDLLAIETSTGTCEQGDCSHPACKLKKALSGEGG